MTWVNEPLAAEESPADVRCSVFPSLRACLRPAKPESRTAEIWAYRPPSSMAQSCDGIGRPGRERASRGAGGDAAARFEHAALRILDQMQNAREEAIATLRTADVDDGGIGERVVEQRHDALVSVVIQCIQGFVDHDPTRLVERKAREHQALLLVVGQLPVPPRWRGERRAGAAAIH